MTGHRRRAALVLLALCLAAGAAAVTGHAASLQVDSARLDAYGAAQAAPTTTVQSDTTAPALTTLEMFDDDTDGFVDRVLATFDEALAPYTAGTTPWTLANVPSGGSLLSVSVPTGGTTATLTLTEGTGAKSTAVGSFTVALAQNAAGIRDTAGNKSSFSATAPTDKAAPVLIDVTDTDGTTNGLFQAGDTISFVTTEALDSATIPTTASVVLHDPQGDGGNDYLTIAGVLSGTVLVGTGYLDAQNLTATFSGSAVASTAGGTTVQVTLSTCSGSCNTSTQLKASSGAATFTLASTVKGLDGLSAVGSVTKSIALF